MNWGIKNYQPCWTNSSIELVSLLCKASLKNQTIQSIWMLWDSEAQQFFEDAPVVICTETEQLEFCANKLEYFSFSINSIDLSALVYWCLTEEEIDETEQAMYWIKADHPQINNILRKKITNIAIVEYQINQDIQQWLYKNEWLLYGVGFNIENSWFRILNGLDCNRLDYQFELDKSLRQISIGKF